MRSVNFDKVGVKKMFASFAKIKKNCEFFRIETPLENFKKG